MIIIKNGALVTPEGLRRADLAMEGDKIVRIAAAIEPGEDDTVQDAIPSRPTAVAFICTGKRTAGATTSARFPTAGPAWSIVPSRLPRALRDSWAPRTSAA